MFTKSYGTNVFAVFQNFRKDGYGWMCGLFYKNS